MLEAHATNPIVTTIFSRPFCHVIFPPSSELSLRVHHRQLTKGPRGVLVHLADTDFDYLPFSISSPELILAPATPGELRISRTPITASTRPLSRDKFRPSSNRFPIILPSSRLIDACAEQCDGVSVDPAKAKHCPAMMMFGGAPFSVEDPSFRMRLWLDDLRRGCCHGLPPPANHGGH